MRVITVLGGSLVGSDYPDGIGKLVEPGSKIVLNVHYSMAYTPATADRTAIECHFDNSAARQPPGQEPRDIAWGESNQDMCAGFLAFTEEP